ncbi:MAG: cysteine desulfurase family protein [Fidelibacterota bacterium]
MNNPVYLDNNASTPLDPEVLEAMLPYYQDKFGNSASIHHIYGREARKAVEKSRKTIASELNANPREIVFTSGATEALNLAIRGLCDRWIEKGRHIVTQVTEHKAVLDTCESMEKRGWEVTYLPVDSDGRVDPQQVLDAIRDDTVLVSIMHANNEIGVLQPIAEIGAVCRNQGIHFLVDAAQTFAKLPIDVEAWRIDLLAATGHKIYGPAGIGMLYVRQKSPKVELTPQMTGGGHERGFRSGTSAVPLIVGFGRAVELCAEKRIEENRRLAKLRDQLMAGIVAAHPDTILNGNPEFCLPQTINLCFPGLDAEALITKMKGVACSTGSACTSTSLEPSHVIRALGRDSELAHSAVRFSLGRFNTESEISTALEIINNAVAEMKQSLPSQRLVN